MGQTIREMALVLQGKLGNTFRSSTVEAAKRLEEVNKKIKQIGKDQAELQKLERQMQKAGQSTDKLADDAKRLQAEMEKAKREANGLRENLSRLEAQEKRRRDIANKTATARGQMLDAAALAVALAAPVKKAIEFESAMADVRKVVDGLDDKKKFKAMSDEIVNLTTKGRIPMAAEQLAQIVAAGGQAGFAGKELIGFARDAAKMGIAFDITAEESGVYMSRWRKSFSLTQKQVVALADKINYLGNTSGAKANQISDVVTRIGPLGKIGGFASGEIAALGASMVAMGVEPERAATGIKKLIVTLNAGESATKQQRDAFDKLGINAVTLSKRMQKDAAGGILSVIEKLKMLPQHEQTAMLKNLFGEEGLAAVGSVISGLDQVKLNLDRASDAAKYAGSMQKEYEERSKTTANSLQILRNQLDAGAITIGNVLLPEINKLVDSAMPVIEFVAKWAEKNPKLFSTIVKVTAGLMAFRVAMLAANYARFLVMGGVVDIVGKLGKFVKWIKLANAAQWKWNASLNANPIGVVALAVAGLTVELIALKRAYDDMKSAQDQLKESKESEKLMDADMAEHNKKYAALHRQQAAERAARAAKIAGKRAANIAGKRALGGPVSAGRDYLVGERGPELFRPRQNGLIVPNLALAGAGGSISVSFNPTININGSAAKSDVASALSSAKGDLERMLRDLLRDERRRNIREA